MKMLEAIILFSIMFGVASGVVKLITGKGPDDKVSSEKQAYIYIFIFSITLIAIGMLVFGELAQGIGLLIFIAILIAGFFTLAHYVPLFARQVFPESAAGFFGAVLAIVSYILMTIFLAQIFLKLGFI